MPHLLDGVMGARAHPVWDRVTGVAYRHGFYLAGGTGLALYLRHRQSADLDFFIHRDFDPSAIYEELSSFGLALVARSMGSNTLNVLCDTVMVQFLGVPAEHQLTATRSFGAANVADVPDILAMKLNAVVGRAKLRDYFDLMRIDQDTPYPLEHGVGLFLARYRPRVPEQVVGALIRSLGYLDDVDDDGTVPVARRDLERFWARRHVEMAANISRTGGWVPHSRVPDPATVSHPAHGEKGQQP